MKKNKSLIIGIVLALILITIGVTFALVTKTLYGSKKIVITSGGLKLYLDESRTLADTFEETGLIPISDKDAKKNDGYKFSIINEDLDAVSYSIYLDEENDITMPIYALRYNLEEENDNIDIVGNVEDCGSKGNRKLTTQTLRGKDRHDYTMRIYLGYQAGNDAKNKTFSAHIRVVAEQTTDVDYYEHALNGAYPVLSDNLIPVMIDNNGTVTKADLSKEWYNYEHQEWANAVVLMDKTVSYNDNDVIPEDNIESYFVWIPKYSYKLWDLGNYSSITSLDSSKVHVIDVKFGLTDTVDANEGECTTPKVAGATGNCQVGDYMTHPAFQAFSSTGFWVGKFESGYKGATSTATAEVDSSDYTKLIIKPNVYTWRNITLGNAFYVSYNYLREDDSHMMKNTEWGAVAYLQHSEYGSRQSVRINNNKAYITGYASVEEPTLGTNNSTSIAGNRIESTSLNTNGTYTKMYNTTTGYLASTTGNITGIYDMSGGTHEFVMGYNESATTVGGSSKLANIYGDFFTSKDYEKYYDKYKSTSGTSYSNRILGDATGEMGPFGNIKDPDSETRQRTSWYGDYANFVNASAPWFDRGGRWQHGIEDGIFYSYRRTGGISDGITFRLVLTPKEVSK